VFTTFVHTLFITRGHFAFLPDLEIALVNGLCLVVGVVTKGYTSDATDDALQANIVNAGYSFRT
jgi:hypothetical protein